MGKFSGMILASDFDSTLTDSQGRIPENCKEAIRYFISNGGYFTVATGRVKDGFHAFDAGLMNVPLLFANGAMAFDCLKNEVIFSYSVDERVKKLLKKLVREYNDITIECYAEAPLAFVYKPDERSRRHFQILQMEYSEINSFDDISFPLIKIMLLVGEKTFEVQRFLADTNLDGVKFIPCSGEYIELLSASAGKGAGLIRLADILAVSRDKIFAAGDGANDVDMLKAAALSFAPENGDALALKAADITVCSNVRGAIADVIRILDMRF